MTVTRWGALAGALILTAAAGAPAPVLAQDRDTVSRVLAFAGRGAHIGLAVEDLGEADAKQAKNGVRVETVNPDGPADKAGIKAGDIITEFDGERVRSTLQFSRLVQETPVGRQVAVVLSRGGQRVSVNVSPEGRTASDDFAFRMLDLPRAARPPRAVITPRPPTPLPEFFDAPGLLRFSRGRLGITVEGIDDQLAEYFGVKEGLLVKSVAADSAAQKAGIKAGDVITAINGSKVYDASDLNRALDRVESPGEFTAEIVRDRKPQSLKGKIESRETRTRVRTIL